MFRPLPAVLQYSGTPPLHLRARKFQIQDPLSFQIQQISLPQN
ncbi:DEKNAAC103201 [Brettanomyces naardenensis]|uniref:DEKNAAC103201 n=1 Tax=Brettanomyces naardenensis TaxID=13370 RepID=A0A448YMV7_BRENA|nr:DEKNAAC103201 [Brettanomyces naardenensis]